MLDAGEHMNPATDEVRATRDEISRLKKLVAFLSPLAQKHEALLVPSYWFNHDPACEEFCYSCAEKRLVELQAEKPEWFNADIGIDGGSEMSEDSRPYCATCGKPLAAFLTDEGMVEELRHFLVNGLEKDSPGDYYSLCGIIENLVSSPTLYADMRAQALKIGDRLLKLPRKRYAQ